MSDGSAAAARELSTFGYEPPLSPEPIGGLRIAASAVSAAPPAAPEPAPTPAPTPSSAAPTPAPAPEPTPEPTTQAPGVTYRLSLRLVDGERIPLDTFATRPEAEQRARRISRELNMGESWSVFGNRYVNPAAVVSIDLDVTGC